MIAQPVPSHPFKNEVLVESYWSIQLYEVHNAFYKVYTLIGFFLWYSSSFVFSW